MIKVTETLFIDERDLSERFALASGPGGQNVNKVATAVSLRYDLNGAQSIPEEVKKRAAKLAGRQMTREGVLLIQASRYRTQDRNRADALQRLITLLRKAARPLKPRLATRPTLSSRKERLEKKSRHSLLKSTRKTPSFDDA